MIDFSPKWPNNENTANQPNLPVFQTTEKWKYTLLSGTLHYLINSPDSDLGQRLFFLKGLFTPHPCTSYEARASITTAACAW